MAIYNSNGSIYVLRGPNPLMKTQQEWDRNQIRLFNIGGRNSEVVDDVRNPVKEFNEKVVDIGEDLKLKKKERRAKVIEPKNFIEELRETPESIPEPTPIPEPTVLKMPEIPVLNVDQKTARVLKERGAEYYCAPAIGKIEHRDDFYGSTYSTTEYGDKFSFDAIILDQSDLELQFWCVRKTVPQSIVYKKDKQGGERWWRVTEIEEKTGGWLVKAITSDSNPDFS